MPEIVGTTSRIGAMPDGTKAGNGGPVMRRVMLGGSPSAAPPAGSAVTLAALPAIDWQEIRYVWLLIRYGWRKGMLPR